MLGSDSFLPAGGIMNPKQFGCQVSMGRDGLVIGRGKVEMKRLLDLSEK